MNMYIIKKFKCYSSHLNLFTDLSNINNKELLLLKKNLFFQLLRSFNKI